MIIRRRELVVVAILALVFGAAPTVGDVGSCGRQATDLDEGAFAAARKSTDCQRCRGCGLQTQTCARACDAGAPSDIAFPATCRPIAHDGEVCLHALEAASCDDYAAFVSDTGRAVPTECDFCRLVPDAGALLGDR